MDTEEVKHFKEQLDKKETEIAKLREALHEIADLDYAWAGDCGAIRIAEEALS